MNPGTLVILNLLGGIALLLWGVRMVRTGVMRMWGERLKYFIEHRLGSRLTAFGAGTAATMIVGSGTATALIVTNIAATGSLPPALGLSVLLGADVGSALVSALVASGSNLALWTAPAFLFGGYTLFSWSREFRPHNAGRILIGLGLMLLSLRLVSQATTPLNEASLFHDVLASVGREPVLSFLVGALMAWGFHSTLAAILLVASLMTNGSLELNGALGFLLGINCGGGIPAFVASLGLPASARRLPLANLIARAILSIILLGLASHLMALLPDLPGQPLHLALAFHVGFNLAVAVVFLPLAHLIGRLVERLVPEDQTADDALKAPRYLDATAVSTPAVALANAAMETTRMSEVLDRMFNAALKAMASNSIETLKQLREHDGRLNAYQVAVQSYLGDVSQGTLTPEQAKRALEITLYVSNLEHAGDIIHLNLGDRIKAKVKQAINFSIEEQASLDNLCLIIHDNIRLATAVLTSGDIEGATRLIGQKDAFRQLENSVIASHFGEGRGNKAMALRQSALFIDIIRDLHRINSHIVAAGYPIVDEAGLLRSSRLKSKVKGPKE
jgi:phosphate:Na+ symporter